MPKPEREWLTIAELVERWKKNNLNLGDIEYYMLADKLKPSVLLTPLTLTECEIELDGHDLDIKPIKEIFADGLFYISGYKNIKWNKSSEGILAADLCNRYVFLSNYEGNVFYYISAKSHIIAKSDIVITLQEINSFEEKQELKSQDYKNTKPEKTLLKVIAVLLEVILGESEALPDKIKHFSIKNQSDLIAKLAQLEEHGLKKRNLEDIFAQAKKAKESN